MSTHEATHDIQAQFFLRDGGTGAGQPGVRAVVSGARRSQPRRASKSARRHLQRGAVDGLQTWSSLRGRAYYRSRPSIAVPKPAAPTLPLIWIFLASILGWHRSSQSTTAASWRDFTVRIARPHALALRSQDYMGRAHRASRARRRVVEPERSRPGALNTLALPRRGARTTRCRARCRAPRQRSPSPDRRSSASATAWGHGGGSVIRRAVRRGRRSGAADAGPRSVRRHQADEAVPTHRSIGPPRAPTTLAVRLVRRCGRSRSLPSRVWASRSRLRKPATGSPRERGQHAGLLAARLDDFARASARWSPPGRPDASTQ